MQGPGENAGIIDIGDGWACAFKIECHNHPSVIEPLQGAATGVGGIVRDIFTMGARPVAVIDSLRFGPCPKPTARHPKNHLLQGVVAGSRTMVIVWECPSLAVRPSLMTATRGNPLVNAFALGLMRRDKIFYARPTGVGNPVIYVGAKTGRDGIHGATYGERGVYAKNRSRSGPMCRWAIRFWRSCCSRPAWKRWRPAL